MSQKTAREILDGTNLNTSSVTKLLHAFKKLNNNFSITKEGNELFVHNGEKTFKIDELRSSTFMGMRIDDDKKRRNNEDNNEDRKRLKNSGKPRFGFNASSLAELNEAIKDRNKQAENKFEKETSNIGSSGIEEVRKKFDHLCGRLKTRTECTCLDYALFTYLVEYNPPDAEDWSDFVKGTIQTHKIFRQTYMSAGHKVRSCVELIGPILYEKKIAANVLSKSSEEGIRAYVEGKIEKEETESHSSVNNKVQSIIEENNLVVINEDTDKGESEGHSSAINEVQSIIEVEENNSVRINKDQPVTDKGDPVINREKRKKKVHFLDQGESSTLHDQSESNTSQRVSIDEDYSAIVNKENSMIIDEDGSMMDEDLTCPNCDRELPKSFQRFDDFLDSRKKERKERKGRKGRKKKPSSEDLSEYCDFHEGELSIIPDGREKNYPFAIDFNKIPARINKMSSELEKILNGEEKSSFMENALEARKENGHRVTRSMILINRFEEFMPGYYGHKGRSVILSSLGSLFKNATYEKTKSLRPVNFFEEVLVPEVAIRLISEDRKIPLDEAKIVMNDSIKFGTYVHNDVDDVEIL